MIRKDERKKEIAALIEEGRAAFEAGRSLSHMPLQYRHSMNRIHWKDGWWDAYEAACRTEEEAE